MVIIVTEIYIVILKDEKNLKKAALDFPKLICTEDTFPTLSSRNRNTLNIYKSTKINI